MEKVLDDDVMLLDERQAGKYLGLTIRALQNWRRNGDGPPHIRLSRRAIRYDRRDLDEWIVTRRRKSTSDPD